MNTHFDSLALYLRWRGSSVKYRHTFWYGTELTLQQAM